MSRYLRYIEQSEKWRGNKTDRHVIDRFNEAYDVIYDSDDYIPDPDAIREFACAAENGDYDLIYCDEDVVRDHQRTKPYFKPGYSPASERSLGYISGMTAVKKGLEYEGLYSFKRDRVCHIEKVLYHRRRSRTVPETAGDDMFFDKVHGRISVIILSKDHPDMLERCVRSLKSSFVTEDTEIVLVDNGSSEGAKRRYEEISGEYGVRYIYDPAEFNYSALNNRGVSEASGEVLVFLNDDIEIPGAEKGIIERLAAISSGDETGACGIKLLYPGEEKIQHCGITLLYSGPSHRLQGYKDEDHYYGYSNHDINVIAVTGACLAVRRDRFEAVGGFDERLPVAYNDVDLCMRLYEAGLYNICMNSHHLIHYEGATRADDGKDRAAYDRLKRERFYFNSKHGELINNGDPYMNKNFSPYSLDFDLNLPYDWELSGYSKLKRINSRIRNKNHVHSAMDGFAYKLSDAYGNEDYFEASGWVFKEGINRLKPCVVIEAGGERYAADTAAVRRIDVGEVFPKFKKSADSGFIARISAVELEKLGLKGEITAYPALVSRHGRIYKGDEECQRRAEI
ncbi:MAG: glycosyltransferase [Lachnospiraceae bacterium]|nr:glycosyltransferase [Lachnospiraceae bacterium]MBQ9607132.1 glycosyltransferase [Lachnospiraceae bacterium]MBR1523237.1 glycosyltransferase [Lachnospiraceae bacterium]